MTEKIVSKEKGEEKNNNNTNNAKTVSAWPKVTQYGMKWGCSNYIRIAFIFPFYSDSHFASAKQS